MALSFLSEVWSGRLLIDLEDESVYKMRANRNYSTDAQNATKVHIGRLVTDIAISDYSRNTDLADPEVLTDEDIELSLDQQKSFHFYVDSIDRVQQAPEMMSDAMRKAAIAIGWEMDTYASTTINDGVTAANTISLEIDDGDTDAEKGKKLLQACITLKRKMMEENISMTMRPWIVLTPAYKEILDRYFLLENPDGVYLPMAAEMTLRQGFGGMLLGMEMYVSNRSPKNTNTGAVKDIILSGTNDAWTYADQIQMIEGYRPEKRFGDAVKGLYVYGAQVTLPAQLFKINPTGSA